MSYPDLDDLDEKLGKVMAVHLLGVPVEKAKEVSFLELARSRSLAEALAIRFEIQVSSKDGQYEATSRLSGSDYAIGWTSERAILLLAMEILNNQD